VIVAQTQHPAHLYRAKRPIFHVFAPISKIFRHGTRFDSLAVMRRQVLVLTVLLATGCAAQSGRNAPHARSDRTPDLAYDAAPAPALVFDPPVTAQTQMIHLDRDDRAPAAFVGFDQTFTTFSYIRTYDRQTNDRTDRFERRAISERVGVSYR
jgi:hypothetical protein